VTSILDEDTLEELEELHCHLSSQTPVYPLFNSIIMSYHTRPQASHMQEKKCCLLNLIE